jgi:general stress protein CsbA
MYHNKWVMALLPLIVLVFAIWETAYSNWIIIIAAVLMLLHSLGNHDCCSTDSVKAKKPKKRKRKK